ncbi:GNAT family N-acetyltransferase [Zhihengliuella sp.]|uniref:GNAT family N-acetyltransferase n=1 Tax=Zhihengliuella sp. TaxID=1954483 RepID=UPI0028110F51|nr:GNAT family N-acetyltransferase [Zhihengliuella sp.]
MRIRAFTDDDVELLAGLARDPRVVRYVGDGRPWPDHRVAERARQALNPGAWGEPGRERWGIVWCDGLPDPAAADSSTRKAGEAREEPQPERIGLCVAKFGAAYSRTTPRSGLAGPSERGTAVGPGRGSGDATVEDAIEIGYWLDPDYWGRRLARPMVAAVVDWVEAGLQRAGLPPADLVARIQPSNQASAATVRRLGFEPVLRAEGPYGVDVFVRSAAAPVRARGAETAPLS